ncbi:hypothetical protein CCMA1212_009628 [Trichoderma ghanense]|uniref:Uncharacterized protein n=1 Tax=Trichoderma ghanense TaxID=65468 RepID=A0ABY2GU61_9HYPO
MEIFDAYPKGILCIENNLRSRDFKNSGKYFLLPGIASPISFERVSMSEECLVDGFTRRFTDFKRVSADSVSTALTTGIAAVIICLVKLSVVLNHFRPDEEGMMVKFDFAEDAAEETTRPEVHGSCLSSSLP